MELLPYENIYQILLNTDYNSVLNYCSTSAEYASICDDKYFWETKIFKDFGVPLPGFKSLSPGQQYGFLLTLNNSTQKGLLDELETAVENKRSGIAAYILNNYPITDTQRLSNIATLVSPEDLNILIPLFIEKGVDPYIIWSESMNNYEFRGTDRDTVLYAINNQLIDFQDVDILEDIIPVAISKNDPIVVNAAIEYAEIQGYGQIALNDARSIAIENNKSDLVNQFHLP